MRLLDFLILFVFFCGISAAQSADSTKYLVAELDTLFNEFKSSETDSALKISQFYFEKGKLKNDSLLMAESLLKMSIYYSNSGSYKLATENIFESLNIFEKLDNKQGICSAYSSLSIIHRRLEEYDKAIEYQKLCLKLNEELKDTLGLANSYLVLGNIYFNIKDNKSAINFYEKGYEFYKLVNDPPGIVKSLNNLAAISLRENDYRQAAKYFSESIEKKIEMNDFRGLANSYSNLGLLYLRQKLYKKSKEAFHTAEEFAFKYNNLKTLSAINKNLYRLHKQLKEYEKSILYLNRHYEINDSLYTLEKNKQIAEIREQYETEKKDQQIKLQKSDIEKAEYQKTMMWGGIAVLFLLALLISIGYMQKKSANRKISSINHELVKVNNTKDKLFRVISHDLRSPLTSVHGMKPLLEHYIKNGTTDKILLLGDQFDNSIGRVNFLLDNLLNWALGQSGKIPNQPVKVNLDEFTTQHLEIYSDVAKSKSIRLEKDIDPDIEIFADFNILRALLGNLINNAIKFTPVNGLIKIRAIKDGDQTQISVIDSGVGIKEDILKQIFNMEDIKISQGTMGEKGTGLGLNICKEFIGIMNGDIKIDSTLGKGTKVTLTIPVLKDTEKEVV